MIRIVVVAATRAVCIGLMVVALAGPAVAETIVDYVTPEANLVAGLNLTRLKSYDALDDLSGFLTQWPGTADALATLQQAGITLFQNDASDASVNVSKALLAWVPNGDNPPAMLLILRSEHFKRDTILQKLAQLHKVETLPVQQFEATRTKIYTLTRPTSGYLTLTASSDTLIFSTELAHLQYALQVAAGTEHAQGLSANAELSAVTKGQIRRNDLFVAGLVKQAEPVDAEETEEVTNSDAGHVTAGSPRITAYRFAMNLPKTASADTGSASAALSLQMHCATAADAANLRELLLGIKKSYATRWSMLTDVTDLIDGTTIGINGRDETNPPVSVSLSVPNRLLLNLFSVLTPPTPSPLLVPNPVPPITPEVPTTTDAEKLPEKEINEEAPTLEEAIEVETPASEPKPE